MTQKQFFGVFQLFVSEIKPFYQKKNIWKNSQWFKTWNNFGKEFASEVVEAAYVARTIYFIFHYLKQASGNTFCRDLENSSKFSRPKYFLSTGFFKVF